MLIIGCGYVGQPFARHWLKHHGAVEALTRSADRAELLRAIGVTPRMGDVTDPESLEGLAAEDGRVLFSVGYDRSAAPALEEVYVEGLRHALDALHRSGSLQRLVYLSSTGVYGPNHGDWVDEQSPCEPLRAGGKVCLQAERLLQQHPATADRHVVLRLAGIYGPGRVPRLELIRAGKPIPAPNDTWLNLIHVDDIVEIAALAFSAAAAPNCYCVSDGQPIRRHDYYRLIAELAGAPPPQLEAAAADSPAAARAAADKRISNRKLLGELPVRLRHPDCRSGLAAILAEQQH